MFDITCDMYCTLDRNIYTNGGNTKHKLKLQQATWCTNYIYAESWKENKNRRKSKRITTTVIMCFTINNINSRIDDDDWRMKENEMSRKKERKKIYEKPHTENNFTSFTRKLLLLLVSCIHKTSIDGIPITASESNRQTIV